MYIPTKVTTWSQIENHRAFLVSFSSSVRSCYFMTHLIEQAHAFNIQWIYPKVWCFAYQSIEHMALYAAWANENHQKLLQRIPSNPYNLTLCRQKVGERGMLRTVIMTDCNMSWNMLSNTHKVFYGTVAIKEQCIPLNILIKYSETSIILIVI